QLKATEELDDIKLPEQASFLHPTAILLNGGVFKADQLTNRLLDTINSWLTNEDAPAARLLDGANLDLSVAQGAAYYGYIGKGKGVRIKGGIAASYYVGVESAMPAVPGMTPPLQIVCIAPFGMEEGSDNPLPPYEFGVVVGEPVRFRFFSSTVRREDAVGVRMEQWDDDEIEELDEIEITLPVENRTPGEIVPVHLYAAITEVGTLQLEALPLQGSERWKVELDVRAGDD
ncbi:MAG: Hsp70 family protein, partial [Methylococcales bacterium]|nr:Hsp70 family protein [Methylococcales bacterium]